MEGISEDLHFVNPYSFKQEDFPIIVLCDDRQGFIGWGIKTHTKGNYNHAMIMHKPHMVATQGFKEFMETDIKAYMKSDTLLKFWQLRDMTEQEKKIVLDNIQRRLELPFWKRGYDFLGTFVGQFLRLRWIQSPFQMFCSEQVAVDGLAPFKRAENMKTWERNPSELNSEFVDHPELMRCVGYYLRD